MPALLCYLILIVKLPEVIRWIACGGCANAKFRHENANKFTEIVADSMMSIDSLRTGPGTVRNNIIPTIQLI